MRIILFQSDTGQPAKQKTNGPTWARPLNTEFE